MLSGNRIFGHIKTSQGGHALTNKLLVKFFSDNSNWTLESGNMVNKNNKIKEFNDKKISYRNKFIELLNPIIAQYASENNIDIVIRKEQMIIGKTELDISDPILAIVNKKIKEIN